MNLYFVNHATGWKDGKATVVAETPEEASKLLDEALKNTGEIDRSVIIKGCRIKDMITRQTIA